MVKQWVWVGVGLVVLGYALVAFIKPFIPLLIIGAVLIGIYQLMFKRPM